MYKPLHKVPNPRITRDCLKQFCAGAELQLKCYATGLNPWLQNVASLRDFDEAIPSTQQVKQIIQAPWERNIL